MRIAFFSTKSYDREFFEKYNDNPDIDITFYEARLKQSTVNLTAGFKAVCVFVNDKINASVITGLKENGVLLIALRCAGFNNIDLEAADKAGIKVVRVPAYSPEAVAEHAVALILTLNRKTHKAFNRIREGNFSLERLTGFNLHGKTVGVIGTGKIGASFCRIMKGFGCEVIAHDLYPSEELISLGIKYCEKDILFTRSDIISLHCPLIPETKHIINRQAYGKMKKGVMLINTSRGALVNTEDTIEALKEEKLGYLGIDVYEQEEKLFFRDFSESIIKDELITRLTTFPNVLITAHQAFFTREALEQITLTTLYNIYRFINGEKLINEVTL